MSVYNQPYVAKLAGTGAALSVNTGFHPHLVIALNLTQLSISIWTASMAQATCIQIKDSGTGTTDILSVASAAVSGSPQGFSLGTNANLNTSADVIHVIAM